MRRTTAAQVPGTPMSPGPSGPASQGQERTR